MCGTAVMLSDARKSIDMEEKARKKDRIAEQFLVNAYAHN